jgi:predicted metalloprotease with PDZ domain
VSQEPVVIRGDAARGWLGVEMVSAPSAQAGALVRDVLRGSPAARAGLQGGDRIIRINGETVTGPDDVVRAVSRLPAGSRVSVAVEAPRGVRMLAVVLAPAPADDSDVMRLRYVGQPPPQLTEVRTVQGSTLSSLRDLRGKVVVLEFWASWCAVCQFLVPKLNRWRDQYQAQGLELVSVTTDHFDVASATAGQLDIRYTVLADPSGKTTEAYRALALPSLFVVDKRGIVRETLVGYDEASFQRTELLIAQLIAED